MGGIGLVSLPFLNLSRVLGLHSSKASQPLPKIGLQLFSVREEMKDNPKNMLTQISWIGFAGLEVPPDLNGLSISDYGKFLKKSGLEVIAIHTDLPVNQSEKNEILLKAKTFKCNRIVWHGLPEDVDYKTEEGVIRLVQKYNAASRFAITNDLEFGINNHWWEFEKLPNGRIPFDILLEQLDKNIFFELDVYWIAVAGLDPTEIIKKAGNRVQIIQVKDGPATWTPEFDDPFPDPVEAVGTGKLDYPSIFEACQGSVEWIVVDIEYCKTDLIQAIYESYRYISGNRFGVGLK